MSGEQPLRAQAARDLSNLIFDAEDEEIDLWNRDKGIARNMYTKTLHLDFTEDNGDRGSAERKRSSMNVLLGWLASLMKLNGGYEDSSVLPQSDGRPLLNGRECTS